MALESRPLRGVFLVMLAVLVFACMDTNGKHLAQHFPVPMFLAARYFINMLLLIIIFSPKHGWALMQMQRSKLVLLRGAALATSSLCAGFALKAMPVAETVAIIYLAPFGVMLLSGPLLKEQVRLSAWVATAAGFIGLLLIVRPGSGLSPTGVMWGLLTIGGTILYHMLSRSLAKTETTMAMLFHAALVGSLLFGAMLPWNLPTEMPSGVDTMLIIAMGVFSTLGHFLFTAAYRYAPVSLLTPVNYMHLAWAALLGWLVFDHIPDHLSMIGIGLVATAGAGNALWNHFRKLPVMALEPEEV
jgi:drug/metabolite transporter (DMT)-like permease